MSYLKPWPVAPGCQRCKKDALVSFYDQDTKETVVTHTDGSAACRFQGGSPLKQIGDHTITFPVQLYPEFVDLAGARAWAQRIAYRDHVPVHLGYVVAHDGHRKIGQVERVEDAISTIPPP